MSLALLFHSLLLNMFRMLVRPSSGACDLLWIYFMCCIALVRCVLVLRCGSPWVVWYPYAGTLCFSLHKDTTPPQPNHTVTPTHIELEQYNTWNKSTVSCKLLKMDVLTFKTCRAVKSEIIKQVTSSWSIFTYEKFPVGKMCVLPPRCASCFPCSWNWHTVELAFKICLGVWLVLTTQKILSGEFCHNET